MKISFLLLSTDGVVNESPENREEESLETIGEDSSGETSPKQAHYSILRDHLLGGVYIRDGLLVSLSGGLDDTDRVGDGVADHRGSESHHRISQQLGGEIV